MTPGSVIAQSCGCICPPPTIQAPSNPLGQVYKIYAACPIHGYKAWGIAAAAFEENKRSLVHE